MKKQLNIKKLILLNLPYILMGLSPPTSVKRGGWPWVRTLRQKCSRSSPRCRWRWPAGGPACTRWIYWWVCAVVLACGWRSISRAKKRQKVSPRHGVWVLPAGEPMRTSLLTSTGVPEQCDSDENGEPDNEQPPQGPKDRQKQKMCW